MPFALDPTLQVPAAFGIALGLAVLVRGMRGHVVGTRIADTSTSTISAIAVGEVRVHGIVEPAELLLVSPLQSAPCVYFRARIRESGDGDDTVFREERSVGFRVRDATGDLRVFPRGASWDVPDRFADSSDTFGDPPPGLQLRTGSALAPADPGHDELVARLLTVRPGPGSPPGSAMPAGSSVDPSVPTWGSISAGAFAGELLGGSIRRRRYEEARLEPGDEVTILGRVIPFAELDDPTGSDRDDALGGPAATLADPEIAADIAEARAAGLLQASPEAAWGNAAIPGFGIGRPVRAPDLDPAAHVPGVAGAEDRGRYERTFDLAPETLVLAASSDVPLVVAAGSPGRAVARQEDRLLLGMIGALLAIGSAIMLAASLSGIIAS